MAEKRMFSSNVIDSDAFLDMSPTARLLYYDMGMRADDDGFIDSPKKIMRIIGASDSDLKELIDNGFVLRFESGVIVIRHWYVNNRVRRDTYHETIYTEEKSRLLLEKNNVYQLRNDSVTDTLQTRDEIGSQNRVDKSRLEKDRLGKDRLDESCACESLSENLAESGQPSQESPIVYFPTKFGEQPIYQRDIDDLSNMFNGSVDVRNEIFSCMAYYSDKPESVSSWRSAVKVWINRTINFNNATKFAIEQGMAKNNGRNHRSMEPDKYKDIIPEDAGL